MLFAQSETATLHGIVRDTGGAPMANAALVVYDAETDAVVREVSSSDTGTYEVRNLKPGIYRIRIDQDRFQTYEAEGIRLEPGGDRRFDPRLVPEDPATRPLPGGPVTRITAPPAPRETRTLGASVDYKNSYHDAPLVDQHPSALPLLVTAPAMQGNGRELVMSGISSRNQQTWALDGVPQDIMSLTTNPAYIEMAETTIAGAGVDASHPVNFNMISRRGGDGLHGMGYVKRAWSNLNARSYFDQVKDSYRVREYFGEFSGPVVRHWTWFYVAGMQQNNPYSQTLYADVPNSLMRSRDFSQFLNADTAPNGQVVLIRDPKTGLPFTGNLIPSGRVSSVSTQFLNYYPSANTGSTNAFTQNYTWQHPYGPDTYNGNWPFGRIDQKLSSSNQLYVRWMQNQSASVLPGSVSEQLDATQSVRYRNLVVSDVQAFGPSVVNELKVSRTGVRIEQGETEGDLGPFHGDTAITATGLQGVNPTGVGFMGFPAISIGGLSPLAMRFGGGYTGNVAHNDRITSVSDSVTWMHGRHAVRAGVQYQRYVWLQGEVPQTLYGAFTFSGEFTGSAFADFLLGLPATSTRQNLRPDRLLHQDQTGAFVADTFRVSRRLTLDYGVRWDYYNSPGYNDGYMANWDPSTGNVIVAPGTYTAINSFYPKTIKVVLGDVVPKAKWTNIRPRVGAAFRLTDNLVLRGGYGEYTENEGYGTGGRLNPTNVWDLTETYTNSISKGVTALSFPKPFPTSNSTLIGGQNVTALPATDEGTIRQYHATLERITHGWTLLASYVGARGTGMNYSLDVNKPRASATPFTTTSKPYPQFASTYELRTDGSWHYDSMVLSARKRTGPVLVDANFTWANNNSNYANTVDPYNVTSKWTRDGADRQLYFVARAAYDLPLGKGRRFLANEGRFINLALGDWSLQVISTVASGQYYSPWFTGPDPANASQGYVTQLPDCVGNPDSGARTLGQWFNPAAFAVPSATAGRYGSCGMNILEGYPIHVAHASVAKRIPLGETVRLGLTARISNVTNTPHFTFPNSNISNPNPGAFASSSLVDAGSPERLGGRQMDFMLRLEF